MTTRTALRCCLAAVTTLAASAGATTAAWAADAECTAYDNDVTCFAWWDGPDGPDPTAPRLWDVMHSQLPPITSVGDTGCQFLGQPLACVTADGWWDGHCWVSTASTDPKDPDYASTWLDHADGAVLRCAEPADVTVTSITATYFWAPTTEPPDTQSLARQAITNMGLKKPGIGMWPGRQIVMKSDPIAVVNLPQWFYTTSTGPGITTEARGSASGGGYTVDAVATYVNTVWYPGDGSPGILCGLGTTPEGVDGDAERRWESPTCGHTYERRGDYYVLVATHLNVAWTGAGQAGVIGVTIWTYAGLHVGEIQVVNSRG